MKKICKQVGVILAVIALGVIGSGLWEVVFKPIFSKLRDFFLNVTSLGIQSLKDETYQMIAQGFHEYSSLETILTITYLFFVFVFFGSLYILFSAHKLRRESLNSTEKSNDENSATDHRSNGQRAIELGLSTRIKNWFVYLAYLMLFFNLFLIGNVAFGSFQIKYVNCAITHYQQLLNICDPYISANDKKHIVSTFAQINNKDDYVSVIEKLKKIAKEKIQSIPKFEAW